MKWYNYLGCPTVKPKPLKISSGYMGDSGPSTWKDTVLCIIGLILFALVIYIVAVVIAKTF